MANDNSHLRTQSIGAFAMVVLRCGVLGLLSFVLLVASSMAAEPNPSSVKPASSSTELSFDRDIRPILAEHCIGCHGGDKPEGGFQLTSRESALKPTENGHQAIVPGKPGESEMIRRLTAPGDERMPPAEKEPLKPAEIEKLRQWITAGANWSQHWAFQPLANVAPPQINDPGWPTILTALCSPAQGQGDQAVARGRSLHAHQAIELRFARPAAVACGCRCVCE